MRWFSVVAVLVSAAAVSSRSATRSYTGQVFGPDPFRPNVGRTSRPPGTLLAEPADTRSGDPMNHPAVRNV